MPTINSIQTEKAYRSQEKSVYVLSFSEKSFDTNKIELAKVLKKVGLDALKINVTNSQQKTKRRGKGGKTILQFRPKKFYVKLKTGQSITEDIVTQINTLLNPIKNSQ